VLQGKMYQELFVKCGSEVCTTKTSDFAKRRTITPTSLVRVIPLKSQNVCQAKMIIIVALRCKYSKQNPSFQKKKQIQMTPVVTLL
jgi:hypothetical protein